MGIQKVEHAFKRNFFSTIELSQRTPGFVKGLLVLLGTTENQHPAVKTKTVLLCPKLWTAALSTGAHTS